MLLFTLSVYDCDMPFEVVNLKRGHDTDKKKTEQIIYNSKQGILAVEWVNLIQAIKNKFKLGKTDREENISRNLLKFNLFNSTPNALTFCYAGI